MTMLKADFIDFALAQGVLRFGDFVTKAGRNSPYFFNAGLFNRGAVLARVAQFYADTLLGAVDAGRVRFDMLFGPAYKGIVLAAATAVALSQRGLDVPFAYNRKEAKDHGEGGVVVGAPLRGRVVIIDDVVSAGTSVRESIGLIRAAGATPAGVLVAIDRMERSGPDGALSERSAVQEIERAHEIPVVAIATLGDLLSFMDSDSPAARDVRAHRAAVAAYRSRYGA